jgi:hypothetical protein
MGVIVQTLNTDKTYVKMGNVFADYYTEFIVWDDGYWGVMPSWAGVVLEDFESGVGYWVPENCTILSEEPDVA